MYGSEENIRKGIYRGTTTEEPFQGDLSEEEEPKEHAGKKYTRKICLKEVRGRGVVNRMTQGELLQEGWLERTRRGKDS